MSDRGRADAAGSGWSAPGADVLARAGGRLDAPGTDVLATVVAVEGSAYRRPGAKRLVEADGGGVGSVSAGCVADRVRRAAASVRDARQPRVVSYDLTRDGDAWGPGVGCGGVVDVLLEPVGDRVRPAVDAVEAGDPASALTVLADDGPLARGDRAYYHGDADRLDPVDGDAADWPAAARDAASALAGTGGGDVVDPDADRNVEVFVDGLAAPPRLVVVGSGHDAAPVVDLAARDGFHTAVVGFRGGVDLDDRVPRADRTVTTSPADVRDAVDVDDRTYAVVMTHNFVDDRVAVAELLASPAAYVGLVGPRDRVAAMDGVDADADRLYAPAGLDLGGHTPYQVATSVVAELLAVHNDCDPGHLADGDGPIHDRVGVDPANEADDD